MQPSRRSAHHVGQLPFRQCAVPAQELDQAREANVVTAAIAALAAIASSLPWPQYQQLLGQFLRLMRRHADGNKVLTAAAAATVAAAATATA